MIKITVTSLLVIISFGFSSLSVAQDLQSQQQSMQSMQSQAKANQQQVVEIFRQLKLTDDQKQQMMTITQKYRTKLLAIQQNQTGMAAVQALKIQMAQELFQVLTDDQKQKLKSLGVTTPQTN